MPILSVFFGIIIRMWHDDHPLPHIHASYQGFEALVDIRSGMVVEGKLPKKAARIVRQGSLLEPIKDENYFRKVYIDAGALSWPHGLELSPVSLLV